MCVATSGLPFISGAASGRASTPVLEHRHYARLWVYLAAGAERLVCKGVSMAVLRRLEYTWLSFPANGQGNRAS